MNKCQKCDRNAVRHRSDMWLCAIHYRLGQMRDTARSRGKYVPTFADLESLATQLAAAGMRCKICGATMQWIGQRGDRHTVSLQHDASGQIRLICVGCNSRHGQYPGDIFYSIPEEHHYCRHCNEVKLIDPHFYVMKSGKISHPCKSCRKSLNREMWKKYGKRWAANTIARGKGNARRTRKCK